MPMALQLVMPMALKSDEK